MSTINDAYKQLNKAEAYLPKEGIAKYAEYHVACAQVLALLAIAEQMEKANNKEFDKVVVYNK